MRTCRESGECQSVQPFLFFSRWSVCVCTCGSSTKTKKEKRSSQRLYFLVCFSSRFDCCYRKETFHSRAAEGGGWVERGGGFSSAFFGFPSELQRTCTMSVHRDGCTTVVLYPFLVLSPWSFHQRRQSPPLMRGRAIHAREYMASAVWKEGTKEVSEISSRQCSSLFFSFFSVSVSHRVFSFLVSRT